MERIEGDLRIVQEKPTKRPSSSGAWFGTKAWRRDSVTVIATGIGKRLEAERLPGPRRGRHPPEDLEIPTICGTNASRPGAEAAKDGARNPWGWWPKRNSSSTPTWRTRKTNWTPAVPQEGGLKAGSGF